MSLSQHDSGHGCLGAPQHLVSERRFHPSARNIRILTTRPCRGTGNTRLEEIDSVQVAHKDHASKRVKIVQGTFAEVFALVMCKDARTATWMVEATSHKWKQITLRSPQERRSTVTKPGEETEGMKKKVSCKQHVFSTANVYIAMGSAL